MPAGCRRRATAALRWRQAPAPPKATRLLLAPRTVSTLIDTVGVVLMAAAASRVVGPDSTRPAVCWRSSTTASRTVTLGSSAGTLVVAALRQRMPSLFGAPDRRRAHA